MRKLATIQKIESLSPIEGADQIVLAKVLGWNVIVRKDEFKEGDLCLYFEIDSLIPQYKDLFFLVKSSSIKSVEIDNEIHTGIRIKTMRMKGVISQGLCLPITTAQKLMREATGLESSFELRLGDDISCELNVYKYEKAIPLSMRGFAKGNFPKWFPKTDLERIQSHPGLIERHKDKTFVIQQKLDGQSQSIYLMNGEFGLCSRNLELKEHPGDSRWQIVRKMEIEEKLRAYGKNYCLQGEFVGPGVQDNRLKLDERTIIFFDVYDIDNQRYLDPLDAREVIGKMGLHFVPFYEFDYKLSSLDNLIELATKLTSRVSKAVDIEGIAIKAKTESVDKYVGRLVFKAINPEYLLKHGE